jgi:hypothetical protein
VAFGTDASGAWAVQPVAKAGAFAHLIVNDARPAILFGGNAVRYAQQRNDGSFSVQTLPGTKGVVGSFVYPVIGIDSVTGQSWAAWTTATNDVFVATRTDSGWSDPVPAMADAQVVGIGVRDGVVHLAADRSGLIYATNVSGQFVEQALDDTSTYWGAATLALLPSGRPIVVLARDEPVARRSGIWLLKGPAL